MAYAIDTCLYSLVVRPRLKTRILLLYNVVLYVVADNIITFLWFIDASLYSQSGFCIHD